MNSSGVLMMPSSHGTKGSIMRNTAVIIRMSLASVFISMPAFSLFPAPYSLFMSTMEPVIIPVPMALRTILSWFMYATVETSIVPRWLAIIVSRIEKRVLKSANTASGVPTCIISLYRFPERE